jgi:hypothetical protein
VLLLDEEKGLWTSKRRIDLNHLQWVKETLAVVGPSKLLYRWCEVLQSLRSPDHGGSADTINWPNYYGIRCRWGRVCGRRHGPFTACHWYILTRGGTPRNLPLGLQRRPSIHARATQEIHRRRVDLVDDRVDRQISRKVLVLL